VLKAILLRDVQGGLRRAPRRPHEDTDGGRLSAHLDALLRQGLQDIKRLKLNGQIYQAAPPATPFFDGPALPVKRMGEEGPQGGNGEEEEREYAFLVANRILAPIIR